MPQFGRQDRDMPTPKESLIREKVGREHVRGKPYGQAETERKNRKGGEKVQEAKRKTEEARTNTKREAAQYQHLALGLQSLRMS